MGKNKKLTPAEEHLILPPHPHRNKDLTYTPIVDTHTHLRSTFDAYRKAYPSGKYQTIWEFARSMYQGRDVAAIVDVWCEAPVLKRAWKDLADSALSEEQRRVDWGGLEYWFVMGVHPHAAKSYSDAVEKDILEAMSHPRCVGWGEIGLDYHYDNSPWEAQKAVFTRQLRHAVRLGKPLTIHTREAEEDTERILKEEVPKDHRIHIHRYTDSPEWADRMLAHFPNLYIGVTGVITYSTNLNTSAVVRKLASQSSPTNTSNFRILLETDAPFMTPSNLYATLTDPGIKGRRLPLCHSAMIPWVAEFVANVAIEGSGTFWDVENVMKVARENARSMYGV